MLFIEGASVLVMALYLARQPALYSNGLISLFAPRYRPIAARISADVGATLRAWVVGQLISMAVLALPDGRRPVDSRCAVLVAFGISRASSPSSRFLARSSPRCCPLCSSSHRVTG